MRGGRRALSLIILLNASAVQAAPVRIDRVTAVVTLPSQRGEQSLREYIITYTDVVRVASIKAVEQGGSSAYLSATAPSLLEETRRYLVQEALLQSRISEYTLTITPEEQVKAYELFRARFADEQSFSAFLTHTGLTQESIRRILRRRLRANLYLRSRLLSELTTSDIEKYKAQHPDTKSLSEEEIKQRLLQEEAPARAQNFLTQFLASSSEDIRIIGPMSE